MTWKIMLVDKQQILGSQSWEIHVVTIEYSVEHIDCAWNVCGMSEIVF